MFRSEHVKQPGVRTMHERSENYCEWQWRHPRSLDHYYLPAANWNTWTDRTSWTDGKYRVHILRTTLVILLLQVWYDMIWYWICT